jgi:truncated hemoglobin YjbI
MFVAVGRAGALLGALLMFGSCDVEGQVELPPLHVDHPRGALYKRLGEEAGITMVVNNFVSRVVMDARINSYFLDPKVDSTRLGRCLVRQVGALSGGPQVYPGEGCRDMRAAHKGMQIPASAFNQTAVHLVKALEWAKVASADIDVILTAIRPTCHDIVTGGTGCH